MGPRGPKFERTEPRIDTDDLAAVTAEALLDLRHVNGRGSFPGADFEDVACVDPLQHAAEDFVLAAPAVEIRLVRGSIETLIGVGGMNERTRPECHAPTPTLRETAARL